MAKKNVKPSEQMCETCMNCLPIGEGDHICDIGAPVLVLEGYIPTDKYFICGGKHWEER